MAFFNIREWLDRISEHPNRRTLTNVEDATDVKTYDLSRAEGEVSVQGTALTGANLTDLERRIGSAFTAVENAMPEANPAETATGSLTKLKVDGTVYEIEGGGGTTIEKITKAEWDAMTAEEREEFIGVVEDTNADYVPLTAENIPFDSNDSIAEKVGKLTVKLTLAEYNALTEKAPNTRYVITDAPALEYTSEDLSYDGGTETTKQKIDEKAEIDDTTVENSKTWSSSKLMTEFRTATTGTISAGTNCTIRVCHLYKRNNVVYFDFAINVTDAISTRTKIGNLPEGFRPSGGTTLMFMISGSTGINGVQNRSTPLLVTTGGDLIVGDVILPSGTIKEVLGCISFIV